MDAVRRHHPDWERFVLVVGGSATSGTDAEPFTAMPLEALNLPNQRQLCFRYSLLELNTAVKPSMFEHVFALGYDRVVYLDPDIVLYSPLAEIESAPPETFITLTPHLTASIGGDELPSDRAMLVAGAYNLGFLAVTRHPALDSFLSWWREKLEYQCVSDTARGLFLDQKWLDLAPGMFPDVRILRHDGYNVAYWNLAQRTVAGKVPNATVNGQPLRFFHFSGYDPAAPEKVSKHDPRQRVADLGDAAALFDGYGRALREAGYKSFRNAPYSYGVFADGTRIPDSARVEYRQSIDLQRAAGTDPFEHPELFQPSPVRSHFEAKLAVRSYRILSRARPLIFLLPRSLRQRAREFLLGEKDPAATPVPQSTTVALSPGLNVAGYVTRGTGVGESARLCRNAAQEADISTKFLDIDDANAEAAPVYRTSIYHVNADQLAVVRSRHPGWFETSEYNIGCWHWELPELPNAWIAAAEPLNEIWAPSAFIQSAISRKVTIPVVHMPHGVEVTELEPCSPAELGVPAGRFTFLCMFDLSSVLERKNPLAAIEAFHRAFPNDSTATLLIKTTDAALHPDDFQRLEEAAGQSPNIRLVDRALSRARVNGLISVCDAVVSLHRSEGFGLVLAEAMYLGKPVVATGWSGNMDFMNSGNSCPIAYELVELDQTHGYYEKGQRWAEPDVDHAAQCMRRLVDDPSFRGAIGERARQTIRTEFSPKAAGMRYRRRLVRLGLIPG